MKKEITLVFTVKVIGERKQFIEAIEAVNKKKQRTTEGFDPAELLTNGSALQLSDLGFSEFSTEDLEPMESELDTIVK